MKTRLINWPLLLALLWLLVPSQGWAQTYVLATVSTFATNAAQFNDWQDFICLLSSGGAGAPPSEAVNAGGNNAYCPICPSPDGSSSGMARWSVSEPYINLHVVDEPLSYTTSSGQKMAFRWMFVQPSGANYLLPTSNQAPNLYDVFSGSPRLTGTLIPPLYEEQAFGSNGPVWTHNWMMEMVFWDRNWETGSAGSNAIYQQDYEALVMTPSGGSYYFNMNVSVSNQSLNPATLLTNAQTGIVLKPLSGLGYPTVSGQAGYVGSSGNSTNGFELLYPDGSQDVFGLAFYAPGTNGAASNSTAYALLTQKIDPAGRVTQLGYQYARFTNQWLTTNRYSTYRLTNVVDADGRTNTLFYQTNNAVYAWQVTNVADPFGRNASFTYATNGQAEPGQLLSITDTADLSSSFNYTPTNMTSLVTPYGTNSFQYFSQTNGGTTNCYQRRAVYVEEPDGASQLYAYIHDASGMVESNANAPTELELVSFDAGAYPETNAAALWYRNSFYWNRSQTLNLSVYGQLATNLPMAITNLTNTDLKMGRMRHWLLGDDGLSVSGTLSSERDPSPDTAGTIEGQRTWYAYAPAYGAAYAFSTPLVTSVARTLSDVSGYQYARYQYYASGLVATNAQSVSKTNGIEELTTWFIYASNGVDLITVSNSAGQYVNLGYTNHQVISMANALGQVTALGWDGTTHNLTSVVFPSGQTVSLSYYPSNTGGTIYNTNSFLSQVTVQPENRVTYILDYTNALPRIVHVTATSVPDFWATNTWDRLNRLTGTLFQDGTTTISNIYSILDLSARKDRVGNWTYYAHDNLQHLTSITDARSNVTWFNWCNCGALTSVSNALGNVTSLNYNNQGLLTNINFPTNASFPNGLSLNWQYDLSGRMTNRFDGAGNSQQFSYNNQGQVTLVTNVYGVLFGAYFDAVGRPLVVTNANGVVFTNSFDLINELTNRWWRGGSNETFSYASNGLIAYTDQDNHWTHFGRDTAGRLIALTNAVQTESFNYDGLDDLTNLIDGLGHNTFWNYNQYGWLTNKVNNSNAIILTNGYDADGRVTNRWMPASGNTGYAFDAAGNITNIIYPAFTDVYQYDALNELTSMTDPVGTTTFTWTPTGQLATETGPWTNSTVSNSYNQGYRTGLSLTQPGLSPWTETYGYDSAWRMTGITSGAGAFGYQYPSSANKYLVGGITLPNGASILNQYDTLSRLTNTALLNSWGHPLDGYVYGLDALGLRTNITRELGLTTNIVSIAYDPIAEVTSWMAKEANNTPRQNEQLSYGYDAGGNLQYRTNNALVQTFTVDSLNQLSNVTRTGTLTVTGALSGPSSNVSVNGNNAQVNGDFTFAAASNSLNDGTNTYNIVAENAHGTNITNILSPNLPMTVAYQYDANGNLTSDGTRSFYYDAENRLTNVQVTGQWRTGFLYDGLGRRRIREDYTWVGGSVWVLTNGVRYICDGMVAIQERDTNNNVLVTYTRGLDLSGSLQGAGGIGGLLARTDSNGPVYYHGDGSGNITALIDGNGNIVARYEYDAFGRVIGKWGAMADENRYQFSSMEYFPNAGLVGYYGRFYDPILCRWPNHDPIGEMGGINLYGFVGNSPVNNVDPSGLSPWSGWWNPFNYSSGWAQSQGVEELNAQLAARDTTLQQFQLDNPTWNGNGNLTAGNMQAAQAAGNLWAAAANGEINAAQIILPSGVAAKEVVEVTSGIADATEQGWFSKAWSKIFGRKSVHIGGSKGRECVAHTAEQLAAAFGVNAPRLEALFQSLEEGQVIGSWQEAVQLIAQTTKLTAGDPVAWEIAGPGQYSVFISGHVNYGFVPADGANLFPYIYDAQTGEVYTGNALNMFKGAVAVPFTKP